MKRELKAIERALTDKRGEATAATRELAESEQGLAILAIVAKEAGVMLRLLCDERIVADKLLLPGKSGVRFTQIMPGNYALMMTTGRVLWERALEAKALLSAMAFPKMALPAAAQTDFFDQTPTIKDKAADGALTLSVYAGRESGALVCVLNSKR